MEVEIELCIGLHGVCVISLLGDEQDWVNDEICCLGAEKWFERLPEHDKPIQGIYKIKCFVEDAQGLLVYTVMESNYEK